MLTISFEAKELIAAQERYPDGQPLRLSVADDGSVELEPSSPAPDDLTYSHLGRTLLLVPTDLSLSLDGKELATTSGSGGRDLVLRDRAPRTHPDRL